MSRSQVGFLLSYVGIVIFAWWLLPLWIVPAFCGLGIVAVTLLAMWPRKPDVQFIWRAHGDRRVWSVTTPRLLWTTTTVVTLLMLSSILTATGGRILGKTTLDTDMPITVMLGSAVAWLTPGILISGGIFLFLGWKYNPSRPCQPSIHIGGNLAAAVRRRFNELFAAGVGASFQPVPPAEVDVRARLVEPIRSQAKEFDPAWPLAVSIEDLEEGAVFERFKRRDEIQKRRLVLRGLEKIFAMRRAGISRAAPAFGSRHLWFMQGLARDEMDEEREDSAFLAQTVGPPFQDVMHRNVRQYLYQMLRALQVDLIFVEDGIDYRKLKKTLRVMFEVYDKSAGKKRVEEIHFQGVPKVKVLIHDFNLDEQFRSETYPEPRFDDLGRARIMHVFRDRGESEEYVEPPFDFGRTPVPMFA